MNTKARQIFTGICESCGHNFTKFKRGNQPYRYCSLSCSSSTNNKARQKLSDDVRVLLRLQSAKRWRKSHPEAVKEQKRKYYARHRDVLRKRRAPGNLARSRNIRAMALAALGNVCVKCGFSDPRALQIDHIDGNGCVERAEKYNRDGFHRKVLADQTGYQLLCANCNWIKRSENSEYRWSYYEGGVIQAE